MPVEGSVKEDGYLLRGKKVVKWCSSSDQEVFHMSLLLPTIAVMLLQATVARSRRRTDICPRSVWLDHIYCQVTSSYYAGSRYHVVLSIASGCGEAETKLFAMTRLIAMERSNGGT